MNNVTIRAVILLFTIGLCGSTVASSSTATRAASQRLPLTMCESSWSNDSILCGRYEVPENRALADGRKISLNIIVIPALAENPEPDPIFFFEGGPGVAATDAAYFFAEESAFRKKRDIVLVDIRGTGDSNPLHCNLVGDSSVVQNFVKEMYPPELVEACRLELEQRADLTQYATTNAMADIDEVRAWLGYEKINIIGISYGGRAAFVYARAYPEHVRSMVLIGPADIESKMPLYHAYEAEEAFDSLFTDCRADSSCNEAFPNLETELRTFVEELRFNPALTTIADEYTMEPTTVIIRADVFVEALRSAMYSSSGARQVPWIVHQAVLGNYAPFLERMKPEVTGYPPFLAEGAYLSITGAEDAPFISATEADSLTAGTLLGDYRIAQQRRAAELWPKGELPEDYFKNLTVDAPTLILQGGRDPVIGCHKAIKYFSNGREIVIPQMAHMPDGLSDAQCIDDLMLDFFDIVDLNSIDTFCIRSMAPPPFKVSEEEE
ncbi:MAG: alpha/beta fold hydrolase [bacterium]|nr:alpha/beta fold hydrolase [bacterium]